MPRETSTRGPVLVCLLLLMLPGATQAANFSGHWFQVELVVFAYDGMGATPLDRLPPAAELEVPEAPLLLRRKADARALTPFEYNGVVVGHSGRLADDPFIILPAADRMLNEARKKLAANGAYRVLLHRAWRQPIFEHYRSRPLLIKGGNRIGDRFELEGLLTLSVETYLAVEADLRLYSPARSRPGPLQPAAELNQQDPDWHNEAFAAEGQYPALAGKQAFHVESVPELRSVALRESRGRMRSGEIHYFDHPRLGMLIHFTRYAAP